MSLAAVASLREVRADLYGAATTLTPVHASPSSQVIGCGACPRWRAVNPYTSRWGLCTDLGGYTHQADGCDVPTDATVTALDAQRGPAVAGAFAT